MSKIADWIKKNHYKVQGFIWVGLGIPTLTLWRDSVLWVAIMSLYANAATAFSGHEAKKAELEAKENNSE